jgi:hypothetical protein
MTIFGGGRRPVSGLWARVAGDVLDLATLGAAAASRRTNRKALPFATANVGGMFLDKQDDCIKVVLKPGHALS